MYSDLRNRLSRPVDILVNTQDDRWYKTEDNPWKPSVTSVIGSVLSKGRGFEQWMGNLPSYKIACEERDIAADRGTTVHELAEKYSIIKKVSTRYEMPDGSKVFGKQIYANPEKYFTDDIMDGLEVAADKEFSYGRGGDADFSTEDSAEEVEG